MNKNKFKGLGRGLDALLSASHISINAITNNENKDSGIEGECLKHIELSLIKPSSFQPRLSFDETELEELSQSIKHNGVIQPIVLRKKDNYYEIITGERRCRAAKLAGCITIPSIIKPITDKEALAIALIENIQRTDLNVIEESFGYKKLIDEFTLTHEELATITGKSRSHVTNTLRLLNLSKEVQELIITRQIQMGHGRALLSLPLNQQIAVANKIIHEQMTTAMAEKYVASLLKNDASDNIDKTIKTKIKHPDVLHLENSLSDKLGMSVNIKHNKKGMGKVVINYASLDELDNLLMYIQ